MVAALAAVLGLYAFSGYASDAQPPQEAGTPDSVRLLHDLSVLAHDSMEGRAPGTVGSARARAFLSRELARAGVEPVGEAFERPFTWGGGGAGVNLIGQIPGQGDTGAIVLTAHYDHEGVRGGEIFNGADDNASGTVTVLEIARLVVAEPLFHSLVIALVDAEESGLQGARAFVRDPPLPLESIGLNVNLDMVSRSGGLLWASGAYHTPSLRPILEEVGSTASVTLRLGHDRPGAPEGADWTNSSDHGPFHAAGIPFVYFGVEDHPDYHRPTDDFENVHPGEFVNSVRTILTALRALDAALPHPDPTDHR
jgi:Zn-dependent M28 family amino/carboxypeptidase